MSASHLFPFFYLIAFFLTGLGLPIFYFPLCLLHDQVCCARVCPFIFLFYRFHDVHVIAFSHITFYYIHLYSSTYRTYYCIVAGRSHFSLMTSPMMMMMMTYCICTGLSLSLSPYFILSVHVVQQAWFDIRFARRLSLSLYCFIAVLAHSYGPQSYPIHPRIAFRPHTISRTQWLERCLYIGGWISVLSGLVAINVSDGAPFPLFSCVR